MSECGYDAGVGVVVGRHIDSLEGCDGAIERRCDALFEVAHLRAERGLVSDCGGHSAEQRGDFHAREDVAVDIVNEQQHVLAALFLEVLSHGEAGQTDASADSGRLVHLAED